jgi:hypothetical protein
MGCGTFNSLSDEQEEEEEDEPRTRETTGKKGCG